MKTIPARPRVLPDAVLLPVEDGVLLDGVGKLQMFRGPLAQTVLPGLLTSMDGTRTVEELVHAFPDVEPQDIHKSLELLAESGLLQTGGEAPCVPEDARSLVSFFRRSLAYSGSSVSAYDAYRQLEPWRVRIVPAKSTRELVDALPSLLHSVSISSVEVMTMDQLLREPQAGSLMVVALATDAEGDEHFESLEAERQKRSFSWLRVKVYRESTVGDIGPLFHPGNESCYRCFQRVHGMQPRSPGSMGLQLSSAEASWAGFVALEVLSILAHLGQAIGGREFRRFNLSDLSSRKLLYPRSRQCSLRENHPSVVPGDTRLERNGVFQLHTANVFEQYVGVESRQNSLSSAWEEPVGGITPEIQFSKTMHNSRQIALGSVALDLALNMVDALDRTWMRLAPTITLDQLGGLLALTAGIREQKGAVAMRWSANAGNLGSPEVYVLVDSVVGLEKGVYVYQPATHSLALFQKRRAIAANEFTRRLLQRSEKAHPNALILLTGAFHRLKKKYGMFAYRLLNLDAGVALGQIRMVARAMRLGTRITPLLADDLIERELSLRSFDEQSTAAVELFARDTAWPFYHRTKQPSYDAVAQPHLSGEHAPQFFADLSVNEVTKKLFKESRVTEHLSHTKPNTPGTIKRASDKNIRERIPLPHPLRKGLSVGDVLKTRRSTRKFGSKPVPIDAIATGLYYSNRADSSEWNPERNVALRFSILARRVNGLTPGVYEYEPRSHELSVLRHGITQDEMAGLFVQDDFADAPCVVWISGDLDQTCSMYGSVGHRRLLLRAGASGHRFWMAVMGLGLGGCLIAGLVPGAARKLLGLNGFERSSLFAVAVGHELGA